jgi:3-phenylpropionate/trans-cinnamate dioxygenase ferredoxin reductase component
MRSVTVVGGSLAGLRAAEGLRREGFDGILRIVGAEDHLPFDRPPLSKQVLAGTWRPDQARLRGADDLDAEWLLGRRATALDVGTRTVTLDNGDALDADGVVIATGALPRRLPAAVAPPGLAGVHVLRSLADSLALGAELTAGSRVVVIGAGFIGSEVAATAKGRGCDVTVIEALPVPLERALGPEMGMLCARLHADNGVSVRLGLGVTGLEAARLGANDGRVTGVRLADDSIVGADVVVVGVGVAPDTDWLEGSGLTLRDGVVCDSRCRAAPEIVAAGDVARWYHEGIGTDVRVEHWTNAAEQGQAAALSLLHGASAPAYAPVPYFWSDQHGTKIQFVGHSQPGDEVTIAEGDPDDGRFVAAYRRGGRLTGALLWNRPARIPHWLSLVTAGHPDTAPADPEAAPA